jgi:hypothetical protein
LNIVNGVDFEGASVEGERTGVRMSESEESGGVDGGGREVKVKRESDVGGEWVGGVGE